MKALAVAFDLETALIQPGLLAPPLVLGSAAQFLDTGLEGVLLTKARARDLFLRILNEDDGTIVCGANIVYDFLVLAVDFAKRGQDVMPGIFAMYDRERTVILGKCDGRVFEIQLAEALHAIAQGHLGRHSDTHKQIVNKKTGRPGRYSLDTVVYEVLGREDAKANDRFRLSYALFDDKPLSELPFEARQYLVDDAKNTLEVALAQAGHLPSKQEHQFIEHGSSSVCRICGWTLDYSTNTKCFSKRQRRNLHDLSRQAYAAWALHLGAAWGFHVNQDAVDALEKKYTDSREENSKPFIDAGIIREDGTEDQKRLKTLVAKAYGAVEACTTCSETKDKKGQAVPGKVLSPVTLKTFVNCPNCDGTALKLPVEVPRSPGGGIGKSRDVLQESGDELLMSYAEQEGEKILSTYIPMMRGGRACVSCGRSGAGKKPHEDWCAGGGYRQIPLTLSPNALVETGRCSYERGVHGLPRKGGVRDCFEARGPRYEVVEVPDDYVLQPGEKSA